MSYPSIVLHAISRDTSSFPSPCLYCQLELDGEDEPPSEMRIVPEVLFSTLPTPHHLNQNVRRHCCDCQHSYRCGCSRLLFYADTRTIDDVIAPYFASGWCCPRRTRVTLSRRVFCAVQRTPPHTHPSCIHINQRTHCSFSFFLLCAFAVEMIVVHRLFLFSLVYPVAATIDRC